MNGLWARVSLTSSDRATAQNIVTRAGGSRFVPSALFVSTWNEVEAFSLRVGKRNTFQLTFAYNSDETWAILAYRKLEFFSTSTSQRSVVGFNDRQGLLGLLINSINSTQGFAPLLNETNCGIRGTFAYRVSTDIELTGCGQNSRDTTAFPFFGPEVGGTVVQFRNLPVCLDNKNVEIYCRFSGSALNVTSKGTRVLRDLVECLSPPAFKATSVRVEYSAHNTANGTFAPNSAAWVQASQLFQYSSDRPGVIRPDFLERPAIFADEPFSVAWSSAELIQASLMSLNRGSGTNVTQSDIGLGYRLLAYNEVTNGFDLVSETTLLSSLVNESNVLVSNTSLASFYIASSQGGKAALVVVQVVSSVTNSSRIGATRSSEVIFIISPETRRRSLLLLDFKKYGALCKGFLDPKSKCPGIDALPPCPPTVRQARQDNAFKDDTACIFPDGASGIRCPYFHKGAAGCFRAAGTGSTAGQQCCYAASGGLITDPNQGAGTADCYSGDTEKYKHILTDVLPYIICCKYANASSCADYYKARPTDDGSRYNPPRPPGFTFGDPHIRTLDGKSYDFNGYGEYVAFCGVVGGTTGPLAVSALTSVCGPTQRRLVAARSALSVNLRFANLQPGDSGTVIVGVGIEDPEHGGGESAVTVVPHPTRRIDVFDGSTLISFPDALDNQNSTAVMFLSGLTVSRSSDLTLDKIFVEISTPSGLVLKIWETSGVMLASVIVPTSLANGRAIGLLGLVNGNPNDEFIASDGSQVVINSNLTQAQQDEQIFVLFGQTWMIRNETSSLFKALRGSAQAFSEYFDESFEPSFVAPAISSGLRVAADAACSAIEFETIRDACYFDIAVTGNVDVFGRVSQIAEAEQQAVVIFENSVPVFDGPFNPIVTVRQGDNTTFALQASDADGDPLTLFLSRNDGAFFRFIPGVLSNPIVFLRGAVQFTGGHLQFIGTNITGRCFGQVAASDGVATVIFAVTVVVLESPPSSAPSTKPSSAPSAKPSSAPSARPSSAKPSARPSLTPSSSPMMTPTTKTKPCGIFGFSVFCPGTQCGFFGRLFGLCS